MNVDLTQQSRNQNVGRALLPVSAATGKSARPTACAHCVCMLSNALFGVLFAGVVTAVGCGQPAGDTGSAQTSDLSQEASDGHDHGGWWCNEHGVPEEDCSLCSSTAAAKFKEKGDWCEEHNRAESQCFVCDPTRAEKFAKLYEAKVGHKPPPRAE